MKQYTVTQKCRACISKASLNGKTVKTYQFTPDIELGTYSEADFRALVGDDFLQSKDFIKFCENGWIQVSEVKDLTQKVINKAKETL